MTIIMSWRSPCALFCLRLLAIHFLHTGNAQQCSEHLWEQQDRHTFSSSPSFLRHIDCQVDISVSVTWHLADWAEVPSTAITGLAEESRWSEEGKYRAKYQGGGGGGGGGQRQRQETERRRDWSKGVKEAKGDLSYSPLSQQHAVIQMSISPRHRGINELRWECFPELLLSLLSCSDSPGEGQQVWEESGGRFVYRQTNPIELINLVPSNI